jgi:hypothetical protein
MPRQRVNDQRFAEFLKLGIGRDQECSALDGQFGGEGIGVT